MQKSSKTLSDSCGICEGKKKGLFTSVTSTCSDIMMVTVRIALQNLGRQPFCWYNQYVFNLKLQVATWNSSEPVLWKLY